MLNGLFPPPDMPLVTLISDPTSWPSMAFPLPDPQTAPDPVFDERYVLTLVVFAPSANPVQAAESELLESWSVGSTHDVALHWYWHEGAAIGRHGAMPCS